MRHVLCWGQGQGFRWGSLAQAGSHCSTEAWALPVLPWQSEKLPALSFPSISALFPQAPWCEEGQVGGLQLSLETLVFYSLEAPQGQR